MLGILKTMQHCIYFLTLETLNNMKRIYRYLQQKRALWWNYWWWVFSCCLLAGTVCLMEVPKVQLAYTGFSPCYIRFWSFAEEVDWGEYHTIEHRLRNHLVCYNTHYMVASHLLKQVWYILDILKICCFGVISIGFHHPHYVNWFFIWGLETVTFTEATTISWWKLQKQINLYGHPLA